MTEVVVRPIFPLWPPLLAVVALILALAATVSYQWIHLREQQQQQRIQDTLWLRQYLLFQLEDLHNKLRSQTEPFDGSAARLYDFRAFLMRQHPELVALSSVPAESTIHCDPLAPWSWGAEHTQTTPHLHWCHLVPGGPLFVATIDMRKLLAQAPWWILQYYHAAILDPHGEPIAATSGALVRESVKERYRVHAALPGVEWIVELAGNPPVVPLAQRWLLAASVLLALTAAAAIVYAAHATRARLTATKALADEVAFRRAMENSLTVGLRARDRWGKILYVNEAFCALTGFRAEELIGRSPPMPYWDPELHEATEALHQQILAGKGPRHGFEIRFRRKDGQPIDVLIFEAPLVDGRGQHIGWMASVIDVTATRQRERELEQQRKRLAAHARLITLGEMAAAIAHELNQPLLAIASYASGAQHLLHQGDPHSPDNRHPLAEALAAIERQALRAGGIVQRIRQFSKQRQPRIERIPLSRLIAEVLELVGPLAKRLRVEINCAPIPEVEAEFDLLLMQQALANVLINAIEAAGDRSAKAPRVALEVAADGQRLHIFVRDWGSGIPAAVQADTSKAFVTTKNDGVGLGVWITRSVLEAHRGHFTLRPHPDGGTEAILSLPLNTWFDGQS